MVQHWKPFSDSELNFPKNHNTCHIEFDVRNLGPAAVTSAAEGEFAHQGQKEIFLHNTNKTKDNVSLSRQLLNGSEFDFLQRELQEEKVGSGILRMIGTGEEVTLNFVVMEEVRRLDGWEAVVRKNPILAAQQLFDWTKQTYGIGDVSLNIFSQRQVRVFHSLNVPRVGVVYSSPSFHTRLCQHRLRDGVSCHSFAGAAVGGESRSSSCHFGGDGAGRCAGAGVFGV